MKVKNILGFSTLFYTFNARKIFLPRHSLFYHVGYIFMLLKWYNT